MHKYLMYIHIILQRLYSKTKLTNNKKYRHKLYLLTFSTYALQDWSKPKTPPMYSIQCSLITNLLLLIIPEKTSTILSADDRSVGINMAGLVWNVDLQTFVGNQMCCIKEFELRFRASFCEHQSICLYQLIIMTWTYFESNLLFVTFSY